MNIAVAQSGGPTCAINASLLGVIKQALKYPQIKTIYGSVNGIEGIINNHLVDLKNAIRTNEDMELLRQTPSTVLGSCRYKLPEPEADPAVYEKILQCFIQRGIKMFFYIGGNDSMDTVHKLSLYCKEHLVDVKIIGIPKTIDNDLMETDHTPGFGSAAKYVATSIQEIVRDSSVYSVQSVTIIEVMGRSAGWLAASSCTLRVNGETAPHLIYLPEATFCLKNFLTDVKKMLGRYKAVVVVVSEGVEVDEIDGGDYRSGKVDNFGHQYLSGVGKVLENKVREEFGCKVRSIELNVMQRCSSHISSRTDIDEAEAIGAEAVRYAVTGGESGKMMRFHRTLDMPYTVIIEPVDAALVANRERFFPTKWIKPEQNNVLDAALPYFLPLIQGEQFIQIRNGLPIHYKVGNILD